MAIVRRNGSPQLQAGALHEITPRRGTGYRLKRTGSGAYFDIKKQRRSSTIGPLQTFRYNVDDEKATIFPGTVTVRGGSTYELGGTEEADFIDASVSEKIYIKVTVTYPNTVAVSPPGVIIEAASTTPTDTIVDPSTTGLYHLQIASLDADGKITVAVRNSLTFGIGCDRFANWGSV